MVCGVSSHGAIHARYCTEPMTMNSPKLLTAEEFWALPEGEGKRELVRGKVLESVPNGGFHGEVVSELLLQLGNWAKSGKHG